MDNPPRGHLAHLKRTTFRKADNPDCLRLGRQDHQCPQASSQQSQAGTSVVLDYDRTYAMRRRTLLQAPLLAGMAQAKPSGFKLSVRVEPLFPNLSLAAQLEKVAEAGYQGFEFGDWRAADANRITRLKNKLGLECACLVGNRGVNPKGMGLCDPAERAGFLA